MDVENPICRPYALICSDAPRRRYANHPALLTFEIANEPGDGPIPNSAAVKTRFIAWLREKHGTVAISGPAIRLPGATNLGGPDNYRASVIP